MATLIRKSPPICLGISVIKLVLGKLRFSKQHLGQTVKMEDGQEYVIFRHITTFTRNGSETVTIFIVSFKFARLTHTANKIVSVIPMLLITGFPGFNTKIYSINNETGYWQGLYQWESKQALEEYKKSFVFRMMNKRAISNSLSFIEIINQQLTYFLKTTSSR